MPECGRHVNGRVDGEILRKFFDWNDALKHRESHREESCVGRSDGNSARANVVASGKVEEHGQLAGFQPAECFAPERIKFVTKPVGKPFFVARKIIGNGHGIRVASAHVRIGVISRNSVVYAVNDGFHYFTFSGNIIFYFETVVSFTTHGCQGQFAYRIKSQERLTFLQHFQNILRQTDFFLLKNF